MKYIYKRRIEKEKKDNHLPFVTSCTRTMQQPNLQSFYLFIYLLTASLFFFFTAGIE